MTAASTPREVIAEALRDHWMTWKAELGGWRCGCGHQYASQTAAPLHQAGAIFGALTEAGWEVVKLQAVLNEVESHYPPDVFTPPPWASEPSRDAVAAEGVRTAIRNIRRLLAESALYRKLPAQEEA